MKPVFPTYEIFVCLCVSDGCYLCVSMYVVDAWEVSSAIGRYISLSLLSLKYHSRFFRLCKECTIEHWRFCSQRKECASELCWVRKECVRTVHQNVNNSRETSRLLNTLEEKLCRGSTERKSHWESCRALSGVHRAGTSVHKENSLSSSKRRVPKEDTRRVVEHSV